MQNYDLVIVGAGISGLRVGIESLKINPTLKCCILEKYGYIGGRVVSWHKKLPRVGDVLWENGAWRVSTSHTRVLELFRKYGLTFVPFQSKSCFIDMDKGKRIIKKDMFTNLHNIYLTPLLGFSKDVLEMHTLKELLEKVIGSDDAKKYYEMFPYLSEFHTLRADIALDIFKHEMSSYEGFGICGEGLSSLIDAMVREFIDLGGIILKGVTVHRVLKDTGGRCCVKCKYFEENGEEIDIDFVGRSCVLALHIDAIRQIEGVKKLPVLSHLKMEPLLRMYMVFPIVKGRSWFHNLPLIVTNSPLRFVIPFNLKKGIIMISYTDGTDADVWTNILAKSGESVVQEKIMKEIRRLFPDIDIPEPLFFKMHSWDSGCTYWLPGRYNIEEKSLVSLHPLPDEIPNLFMCGESFAIMQCWMESALTQADKLLELSAFKDLIAHPK